MNALRNLWSRPLCLLRQGGQQAFLNFSKTSEDGLKEDNTAAATLPKWKSTLFVNTDFRFANQKLKALSPGQISPKSLQHCRRLERKVQIAYICKICDTRNNKFISELAYTSGVVILQCDGCGVDHLIKDNLGWFTNTKGKSFDEVLAEKGNYNIKVIKVDQNGALL